MPLPGVVQLQWLSTALGGQHCVNTLHLADAALSTPPDLDKLALIAGEFYNHVGQQYLNLCSNRSTLVSLTAQQVRDPTILPTDVVLEYELAAGIPGTRPDGNGNVSANTLTGLLVLKTPNASRRFRGHNFLPPFLDSQAFATNSILSTSTWWTAATLYATKLSDGIVDSATRWPGQELPKWSLVCYSRRAALQGTPYVANVSHVQVSPALRWLRSRNKGTV